MTSQSSFRALTVALALLGGACSSSTGTPDGAGGKSITAGRPSDATDALVLANVQAAKYGK